MFRKFNDLATNHNTALCMALLAILAITGYLQGGLMDAAISSLVPLLTGIFLMHTWPAKKPKGKR